MRTEIKATPEDIAEADHQNGRFRAGCRRGNLTQVVTLHRRTWWKRLLFQVPRVYLGHRRLGLSRRIATRLALSVLRNT